MLPLAALVIAWLGDERRLDVSLRRQRTVVRLTALAWTGLATVVLVQALRGQALTAPDALTSGSAAALVLAPALAAAAWLGRGVGSGSAERALPHTPAVSRVG